MGVKIVLQPVNGKPDHFHLFIDHERRQLQNFPDKLYRNRQVKFQFAIKKEHDK